MSLQERINEAHNRIDLALAGKQSPAILTSFGKDSLVLIDLLGAHMVQTAYFLPHIDDMVDLENKVAIIKQYGLSVTNLPQGRLTLTIVNGLPQLIALSSIGHVLFPVPIEMTPHQNESRFNCVDEMLRADKGEVSWQLRPDLLFWGHKKADLDERDVEGCFRLYGMLPDRMKPEYHTRMVAQTASWKLADIDCCSPLIDWSKDDVWDYIQEFDLPISTTLYHDRVRTSREIPCCYRCHDPDGPPTVDCPLSGKPITNLPHFTKDADLGVERLKRLGLFTTEEAKELSHA